MSFADEDGPMIFANGFTSNDCQEVEFCDDDDSVCSEVSTIFSVSRSMKSTEINCGIVIK